MAKEIYARLRTSHGDIVARLFPDHAPTTVRNFVELAEGEREWFDPSTGEKSTGRFYDGLTFHRVIDGFMVQTGCPLGTGTGGPGYRFGDEIHPDLTFDRAYLLGMANAGPDTNGSQFFITLAPQPHLNRKHTIFGLVEDEQSQLVVDAIGRVETGRRDRPVEPVGVRSIDAQRRSLT